MITVISITAAEILTHLEKIHETTLMQLVERFESLERPEKIIWMSLGWLVREGYVKWVPGPYWGRVHLVNQRQVKDLVRKVTHHV